jgi:hypothetical protein
MNQGARKDWRAAEPVGLRNLCELAQTQTESYKLGEVIDRINRLLARYERKAAKQPRLGVQRKSG